MQVILGYSSEWYPPLDPAVRCLALCCSSELNSGLFSQHIFQKQKVAGMNSSHLFTDDVGIYMRARLTWMFRIWKARSARGHDHISDNELRRENWTLCWFHTDYFNREYLFWMWLTSFKISFKKDISSFLYIYFSCLWGEYSRRFMLFYLHVCEERWQRLRRQRTHPVFIFFILQKHIYLCIVIITTKQSIPFEVSNDTLCLSVRSKLTEYF